MSDRRKTKRRVCPPGLRACFKNEMVQIWSAAAADSRREEGAYPQDTQVTGNAEDALASPKDGPSEF